MYRRLQLLSRLAIGYLHHDSLCVRRQSHDRQKNRAMRLPRNTWKGYLLICLPDDWILDNIPTPKNLL